MEHIARVQKPICSESVSGLKWSLPYYDKTGFQMFVNEIPEISFGQHAIVLSLKKTVIPERGWLFFLLIMNCGWKYCRQVS